MTEQPFNRWRVPKAGLLGIALGILGTLLVERLDGSSGLFKSCTLSDEAQRGKAWSNTCRACHDIAATQPAVYTIDSGSSGGPNLQNVYGSLAGTAPAPVNRTAAYNHPYPPLAAARLAGVIWTDDNLFEYLAGPKQFLTAKTGQTFDIPIFYMQFFIGDPPGRRDVIAYLRAIKGRPECD